MKLSYRWQTARCIWFLYDSTASNWICSIIVFMGD